MSHPPLLLERPEFYSTDLSILFSPLDMTILILCGGTAHAFELFGPTRYQWN
jgi:hypothetical protein